MKILLAAILFCLPALAANPAPAVAAVTTACGPDNVKFKVSSSGRQPAAEPEPGKALVYVVEQFDRPSNEIGRPTIRVGLDGSWMGANRGTSYLSFSVEPGEHHLCTDWQSLPPWLHVPASLAGLTAEPAQTYYFRARVMENRGYFTLDLEPVNGDEGRMLVETSPLSGYRPKK
jgi:hypothetical protein